MERDAGWEVLSISMMLKALKLDDYSHESREVEKSKYWVQSNTNKEVGELRSKGTQQE